MGEPARSYDLIILGGGWAGLLAAREIRQRRPDLRVLVLEQSSRDQAGGLLRSEIIDGFTFDCGGPHILFSKYPETLAEVRSLLQPNVKELPRRNYVRFEDRFVPYPFENGIYQLSPGTRARIGAGLIEAALARARDPQWAPKNFRDWVYGFFGPAMGAEYLDPYNRKIWKRPLEELSADWVFTPGRVPLPEVPEIARAVAGVESVGYKEQAQFIYPARGGIQSLYNAALSHAEAAGAEVRFDTPVRSVERAEGAWAVNGIVRAPRLVNTLPLPMLLRMLRGTRMPGDWGERFDYNRVLVVGVGIDRPDPGQTAVYVPQPDVIFHRYTWMSYLNPPSPDRSNLIAEVTVPRGTAFDADRLVEQVLAGLTKLGVMGGRSSAVVVRSWMNEYGYPIYRQGHASARREVVDELGQHGIWTVGRWGSWEYWNTDMVLRAVRSVIGDLLAATPSPAGGSPRAGG